MSCSHLVMVAKRVKAKMKEVTRTYHLLIPKMNKTRTNIRALAVGQIRVRLKWASLGFLKPINTHMPESKMAANNSGTAVLLKKSVPLLNKLAILLKGVLAAM